MIKVHFRFKMSYPLSTANLVIYLCHPL